MLQEELDQEMVDGYWDPYLASLLRLTESQETDGVAGCWPGHRSPDTSLMLGRPALSSGVTLSELRACWSGGIRRFATDL